MTDVLTAIIPSKTRRKILALFFQNIGEMYYLRKIVREVDEEVNAVKREVDILEGAGLLTKERRLNKVFYSLNKSCIFFKEFLHMFAKTTPFIFELRKNAVRLGRLRYIAISEKYAKKQPIKKDEIYLLFVGLVNISELEAYIREVQQSQGFELNYTVMTDDEFVYRKRNNDPFIWRFLRHPKILILGDEEDLMK